MAAGSQMFVFLPRGLASALIYACINLAQYNIMYP